VVVVVVGAVVVVGSVVVAVGAVVAVTTAPAVETSEVNTAAIAAAQLAIASVFARSARGRAFPTVGPTG
jgi:hypothetical protein